MAESTSRPCRACGMPLLFVNGMNGKPIPLQRIRRVYKVTSCPETGADIAVQAKDYMPSEMYVSHFETCPKASTFSKGSKRNG